MTKNVSNIQIRVCPKYIILAYVPASDVPASKMLVGVVAAEQVGQDLVLPDSEQAVA